MTELAEPAAVQQPPRLARDAAYYEVKREIEEFLYSHPDILDVQIIGVPDEKYGEEVMASVIMRAGRSPLTLEALKAFCKD
eukprot:gene44436-60191_t